MKIVLNREYGMRHLFVALLMLGLSGWFGYDGFIRYPSTPAHDLYVQIEKDDPGPDVNLSEFRNQKIHTQYGLSLVTLLVGLVVGLRLLASARFCFSFDDAGFVWGSRRYGWNDIAKIDDSAWNTKRIVRLTLRDGRSVTLDAWHHLGVKEFHVELDEQAKKAAQ